MSSTQSMPGANAWPLVRTILGDLKRAAVRIQDTDIRSKVLDLQEHLVDMREYALELREENTRLRAQLEDRGRAVFRHGAYWFPDSEGELTGPFCRQCYDSVGLRTRLHEPTAQAPGRWVCPTCKMAYEKKAAVTG